MAEKLVLTSSNEATSAIFGAFDANVRLIERAFDVRIGNRNDNTEMGDALVVTGDPVGVDKAVRVLEYLKRITGDGETLSEESVEYVIGLVGDGLDDGGEDISSDIICVTNRGKPIKAKTIGQKKSLRTEMAGNVPAKRGVAWYVLSDQDSVKAQFAKKYPQYVVSTSCDMTHTNRGREVKADPGFTCALVENYLLSMSDVMILTTRSTYGYLARHRTNTPYVTVDIGDYAKWTKRSAAEKKRVPIEVWDVLDI